MTDGLENAARKAAVKIAQYVKDIAEMKVETLFVRIGADGDTDFSQAKPVARTIISLDGDSRIIIPVRQAETDRFEVDGELLELHQSNVQTAIDYRARILEALLSALQSLSR